MGLLGASIGLSFVLGPAVGALLAHFAHGFGAAAFVAAGLAALNWIATYARLREPVRAPGESPAHVGLRRLLDAFAPPGLRRLLGAGFLAMSAMVAMETTLAFLVRARFAVREGGL